MIRALVAIALIGALTPQATAHAEPTQRTKFYGDVGLGFVWVDGYRFQGAPDATAPVTHHVRWSLGARFPVGAQKHLYLGPVVDLLGEEPNIGVEAELSVAIEPRWNMGPRLSLSDGGFGRMLTAGLRLRRGMATLTLDMIIAPTPSDGATSGLLLNVGLGEKPGTIATLTSAGAAALLFALAFTVFLLDDEDDDGIDA